MRKQIVLIGVLILLIVVVVWVGQFISSNMGSLILLLKSSDVDVVLTIEEGDTSLFSLPPGFSVGVFAKDLGKPRVMIRDTGGIMLVSLINEGKVVALPDRDQNGKADEVVIVKEGLKRPHGLAIHCFPNDEFGIEFNCSLLFHEP